MKQRIISVLAVAAVMVATMASSASGTSHTDNALDFDGVNDVVATDPITTGDTVTFEAWVKPDRRSGFIYLGGAEYSERLEINRFGRWQARLFFDCDGGCANVAIQGPIVSVGQWTHLAYVIDLSGGAEFFVNGVSVGTNTAGQLQQRNALAEFPKTSARTLGARSDLVAPFDGQIDEFRIWNVARTAVEISATMSCGLTGSEFGLEAYYTFNQGVAGENNAGETTLFDSTSNGNNATLVNFALNDSSSNWVGSGSPVATNGLCPAEAQIDNLGAAVDGLVASGDLTAEQALELELKLDAALEKLDNGKPDKAIKKLDDFIKLIDQYLKDERIDPGVAQDLKDAAQAAIDSINAA